MFPSEDGQPVTIHPGSAGTTHLSSLGKVEYAALIAMIQQRRGQFIEPVYNQGDIEEDNDAAMTRHQASRPCIILQAELLWNFSPLKPL